MVLLRVLGLGFRGLGLGALIGKAQDRPLLITYTYLLHPTTLQVWPPFIYGSTGVPEVQEGGLRNLGIKDFRV